MESKVLNFVNALTLADLLYTKMSQYTPTMEVTYYIEKSIIYMSDEEISWIISLISPNSFTADGSFREIVNFILESKIVQLLCSRPRGVLWQD
jgi:hypothetical protein